MNEFANYQMAMKPGIYVLFPKTHTDTIGQQNEREKKKNSKPESSGLSLGQAVYFQTN